MKDKVKEIGQFVATYHGLDFSSAPIDSSTSGTGYDARGIRLQTSLLPSGKGVGAESERSNVRFRSKKS
jgi:hypothetical protein